MQNSVVGIPGQTGSAIPGEVGGTLEAALGVFPAFGRVEQEDAEGMCEVGGGGGIDGKRGVGDYFGETGGIGGDDWGTAGHGFERGEAKAFVKGWVAEDGRARVEGGEVSIEYVTGEADAVGEVERRYFGFDLGALPAALACYGEAEIREVGSKDGESANEAAEVLAGLFVAHSEDVGRGEVVCLANASDFFGRLGFKLS